MFVNIVIKDVKNRVFRSCCYTPTSLRDFSKTPDEFLESYELIYETINVWWLDFPQPEIIQKLIHFNEMKAD